MTEAFFVPDGDLFVATQLTRGPWHATLQHGGPPAALLARAIERAAPGMFVARLAIEFVRPIPIAPLSVSATVLRAGKKVQVVGGSLSSGGKELARATAVCWRPAQLDLAPLRRAGGFTPASPEQSEPFTFPFFTAEVGYHTSVEVRVARGRFGSGAMAAWMRQRVALVAGEAPSALERVVAVADSGNGVSVGLDLARWTFVNPELTLHLTRPLEGEWVCLDAATVAEPSGAGLADTELHDARGPIGRSCQSLLIEPRPEA